MSTANFSLAEAYVMKKLHKEKMKKMELVSKSDEEIQDHQSCNNNYNRQGKKADGGCFSLFNFNKIHPNINASAASST
ncbi:hypothetical protein C2S51_019261 [Perilla frutescens var. frutescens]|nr:hypothetical protein C2S51_019261 [Perilla frutescens var. frutescens]